MELGNKIKRLRYKSGLTQEQLAERVGVSPQSVSKWENAVSMPDISLLPALAEAFGVSIDELFDLTAEQKLSRIENRLDAEDDLPGDVFRDYEEFLKGEIAENRNRPRAISLLANLYYSRMDADSARVSRLARESIRLDPGKKDCQWLLSKAEGAAVWDWNVANHTRTIDFFRELVDAGPTPLACCYLLDNLLADHRAAEAAAVLETLRRLPGHKPCMIPVYEAHIALAEYDAPRADAVMEAAMAEFGGDPGFLFEKAQYHARKCEYDRAVACYEASWAAEEDAKPRFIDTLQGIAVIHEIRGAYKKAVETYDRILACLRDEWGFTEEALLTETEAERNRLLNR